MTKRGTQEPKSKSENLANPAKSGKVVARSQTIYLKNAPCITGSCSIVGQKEGAGPLGKTFNYIMPDDYFGEKTHEAAEQKMFEHAIRGAIKDAKLTQNDIDVMLSGDLLNQITSSSFAARTFDLMFVGLYGACSTMALSLAVGGILVDGGYHKNVVVSAGSHFATAERQYRTPLELGNTRPPVSQWTVTGCGASVISGGGRPILKYPKITAVTFGKVVDWGTIDVNNMGAAMAPAAAATLIAHFRDIGIKPSTQPAPQYPYDAIFTGDLGKLGETALRDLMANANYPLDRRYSDCGRLIYSDAQNPYQGGSGCGCSAVTLNGFIIDKLRRGKSNGGYDKILFAATGALLSPVSSFQGNTIPGIAHAVVIES